MQRSGGLQGFCQGWRKGTCLGNHRPCQNDGCGEWDCNGSCRVQEHCPQRCFSAPTELVTGLGTELSPLPPRWFLHMWEDEDGDVSSRLPATYSPSGRKLPSLVSAFQIKWICLVDCPVPSGYSGCKGAWEV